MFSLPEGRPAIMGVLNVTPDSFSDGGQFLDPRAAVERGLRMIEEGADVVDIGGESTRPGADGVSAVEELRRVLPVIEKLSQAGAQASIDTRKPEVAHAALEAGASIVNDVGGLRDPDMRRVCSQAKCIVCIMHMLGEPSTMQRAPTYGDVVREVREWLLSQARLAESVGIDKERIWIDPGIGFGKTVEHNLALLRQLDRFAETGYPVLVGISRKSFIGKLLGSETKPLPVGERLEGTLAAQVWAQIQGARIIRCHDVLAARRAAEMTCRIVDRR